MNKCGTCRYFGKEIESYDETISEMVGTGLHKCEAIQHGNFYDYDEERQDRIEAGLANVVDGSGYQAALRVRDDFGCVLWEAKE